MTQANICQARGYSVKSLKAGIRNSKELERGRARGAGNEATEVSWEGMGREWVL